MAGSRRSSVVRDQWSADLDRDPRPMDSRRGRGSHRGDRGRGRHRERGRSRGPNSRPFDHSGRSPPGHASRFGPDPSYPPGDTAPDRSPPHGSPGYSPGFNDNRRFNNSRLGPHGDRVSYSPGPMDRENHGLRRDDSPLGPPSKRKRTRSPSPRGPRGSFPLRRGSFAKQGERRDRSPPHKNRGRFPGRGGHRRRSPRRGRDRGRGKDRRRSDLPPTGRSWSPGRGRGYRNSPNRRSRSPSGDVYSDRDSRYRSRSASRHSMRSTASKASVYSSYSRGDEPSKPHKHPYTRLDDRSISPHPNQIHDESRMDRSDEGLDHMRDNFANHGKRGSKLPNKQGRRHPPFQHDSRPYPTSPRFTPNSHPGSPPKSPHSGGRGERHRNPDSGPGPSSPYQQDNQYSHKTYSGQPYKMREERYGDLANRHPPSKLDEQTYRGGHPGHRGNHTANGQGRRFSVSSRSQNNGSPQRGGRGHFNSAQWTTSRSDGPSGRQSSRPSSPYENQTTLNHPSNFVDPGSPHGSEKIKRLRNPDRDDHEDDRSSILSGGVDQAKPEQAASATRESDNTIPADKKGRFSFAFKTKTPQAPAPKPVPDLAQRMQIRDPPPRAPAPDPPTPRNRLTNGPMPKFKPDPPSRFDRRERDRGRDRDRRDDRRHPRDSRDNRDARDFRDSRDKRDDRRFDQRRDRRGRGDRRPDFNPRDMSPIESLREQFREPREIPPPTPPKRTKVLTRYKPRPVIPQEFAQADSVYYRKPGNESVIGAGTYGKVFKGIHVFTQRKVALKKIRMEGEKDGFPVTAVREVKLLQHLRNHNVVSLLEVMVEHNECFMVFEYLSHDLTGLINHPNFNLTLAHKKNLAQQMFEGLSYLHHRGVLHRDIKAANILISNQGLLKFADFGLARFFSKSRPLDYTNRVITIWYRPPELLLGETRYGPAVDVWSAACVCMEMFTKKAVFPGEGGELSQLDKLFNCLGTPAKSEWPDFVEMPWFQLMRPTERKKRIFEEVYREVLTPQALDMISTVFQYDPAKRPTAEEVLQHPYFVAEEPLPQQPTELEHMEGDWHEFESKALRKEARRAEQQTQKDREKRKAGPPTDRDPKRSRQGGSEHS